MSATNNTEAEPDRRLIRRLHEIDSAAANIEVDAARYPEHRSAVHVRFGSLAEVEARLRCVRSSPSSRHHSARSARPYYASSGHCPTSSRGSRKTIHDV